MRISILVLVLAAGGAAPAAAQIAPGYTADGDFAEAQAAQRRREVALDNRLNALDAQRRADEGVAALREQSAQARLPFTPPSDPRAAPDAGDMATIPDARLSQSNARVREAAGNRR